MNQPASSFPAISPRHWLAAVLLISAAARLWLAADGGQFFFGDERRFLNGVTAYQALRAGDWQGLSAQLMRPEHTAFNHLCTFVAAVQHGLAQFTVWSDWSQAQNIYASIHLGAAVLSLFSVLNIWLVHRLARAAGAGEGEAGWVALLMAASHTLFYYARHLIPYDCSLSAALAGLIFALSNDPRGHWRSGAFAALCYHLYNGYWFLVPVVFLAGMLGPAGGAARWRAGAGWMAGCLIVTLVVMAPGAMLDGASYWQVMSGFSGSVTQGLFAEGWSMAMEYLWHSEGWLGVAAAIGASFALCRSFRPGPDAVRLRRWGLLLLATWLLPVVTSVFLHKFVMYARTVRPLVPLVCLLGGFTLHQLAVHRPRWRGVQAGVIAVVALAAFAPHFGRVFPRELELRVLGELGMTRHTLSFTGSIYEPLRVPVLRPDLALVNAQFLYPLRDYLGYPAGVVLISLQHPLVFPPYQYEGHVPRERRLLREHPPLMQLVRLGQPGVVPDHPPPALVFTDADRPDGRDHNRPQ